MCESDTMSDSVRKVDYAGRRRTKVSDPHKKCCRPTWNLAAATRANDRPSRKYIGHKFALIDDNRTAHEEIMHANARLHWRLKTRASRNRLRIEDNDVGVCAFL